MVYNINLVFYDGHRETWTYDVQKNMLYDNQGIEANSSRVVIKFTDKARHDSQQIRIVLGHACNYACSYCTQNPIKKLSNPSASSIKKYVKALKEYSDRYYSPHKKITNIVFWGGEPFLYVPEMTALISEIKEQFDTELKFHTVSNGSLIKGDVLKFILDNDIGVGVSYDGPGQFVRNKIDIFEKGSETRESILELGRKRGFISLSAVFHKYNPSARRYLEYTTEKLGTDDFNIGEMYYNRVHDDIGFKYVCTAEQMIKECIDRTNLFITDSAPQMRYSYLRRAAKFIKRLGNTEIKADCQTFEQKDYFAVDLDGHLWGCHNIKDEYKDEYGNNTYKGNLYTGENHILDFAALRKRMPRCKNCILRWVCCGGCPYTPSKYDNVNCFNYWHFYYPFFANSIYILSKGGYIDNIVTDK